MRPPAREGISQSPRRRPSSTCPLRSAAHRGSEGVTAPGHRNNCIESSQGTRNLMQSFCLMLNLVAACSEREGEGVRERSASRQQSRETAPPPNKDRGHASPRNRACIHPPVCKWWQSRRGRSVLPQPPRPQPLRPPQQRLRLLQLHLPRLGPPARPPRRSPIRARTFLRPLEQCILSIEAPRKHALLRERDNPHGDYFPPGPASGKPPSPPARTSFFAPANCSSVISPCGRACTEVNIHKNKS